MKKKKNDNLTTILEIGMIVVGIIIIIYAFLPSNDNYNPNALVFEYSDIKINSNQNLSLSVLKDAKKIDNNSVTWNSSDTSVATVDSSGNIHAIKEGKTTITATLGNESTTCTITVTDIMISLITLPSNVEVNVDEEALIEASIMPRNAANRSIIWESSDSSIATIDSNGKIKGIKEGTVTITAKSTNNISASTTVTVNSKPITGISLPENIFVDIGETYKIIPVITPTDTTDKNLSW